MNWNEFFTNIGVKFTTYAIRLVICALVFIVGRFIIKFIVKRLQKGSRVSKLDNGTRKFIGTFVKTGLYVILIITLVAIVGVPMASIITVIGAAGAAIALAVQGTLGNVASGLILNIIRPFKVDDFIEADGKSGTVLEIGLFSTKLVTIDNKHVVIPNSALTNATIINYTAEDIRRVDMVVSAAYGSDIDEVKAAIAVCIDSDKAVLAEPEPFVRMTDMNESSIDFTVRVWVKTADYWNTRFNLSENIYNEFNRRGIQIPFKQVDIHVKR